MLAVRLEPGQRRRGPAGSLNGKPPSRPAGSLSGKSASPASPPIWPIGFGRRGIDHGGRRSRPRGSRPKGGAYLLRPPSAGMTYYARGGEPPGRWAGAGRRSLELGRTCYPGGICLLPSAALDPKTGEQLVRQGGPARQHTAGWDMTFSAPEIRLRAVGRCPTSRTRARRGARPTARRFSGCHRVS